MRRFGKHNDCIAVFMLNSVRELKLNGRCTSAMFWKRFETSWKKWQMRYFGSNSNLRGKCRNAVFGRNLKLREKCASAVFWKRFESARDMRKKTRNRAIFERIGNCARRFEKHRETRYFGTLNGRNAPFFENVRTRAEKTNPAGAAALQDLWLCFILKMSRTLFLRGFLR